MKKAFIAVGLSLVSTFSIAAIHCENYPHWRNCKTKPSAQLNAINTYISAHAPNKTGHPAIAAFDWDGTLYDEQLPQVAPEPKNIVGEKFAGQASWMLYSATRFKSHPRWFPTFHTGYGDNGETDFINANLYTEGRTTTYTQDITGKKSQIPTPQGVYSKFVQTAAYTTGMSPKDIDTSANAYMAAYPTQQWAYLPMLDIVQHMHNLGYTIWIITGSIPYFVASEINNIQNNPAITYNGKPYNLGILPSGVFNPSNPGHIAGNEQKLSSAGKFTQAYDNKFLVTPNSKSILFTGPRLAVDHEGKAAVINNYLQNLRDKNGKKESVIFYAGNSGGDFNAASYVLNAAASGEKPGFVVAVQSENEGLSGLFDVWKHFKSTGNVVCLPHMGNPVVLPHGYAPGPRTCTEPK